VVLAEYHRIIEQDRWLLTIPQVCMPIWQDFIDYAVMSALKAPADADIDPLRDAQRNRSRRGGSRESIDRRSMKNVIYRDENKK
jgi:hypothetical protein